MTLVNVANGRIPTRFNLDKVSSFIVSLVFATSFYVKFEPAPTDIFILLALLVSLINGIRLTPTLMPLFLFLLIYNLSGLLSYSIIEQDRQEALQYIIGLAETSISAVFLAAYVLADPSNRFRQIIKAYWIGATIGASLGLCSYFKIEPIYSIFPDYGGRALGGYKDPNVFSTWLILPFITMLQGFILGTLRLRPLSFVSFMLIFTGLFLAFSRGAWINAVTSSVLMIAFTYSLSPSRSVRGKIMYSTIFGFMVLAAVLTILLSVPETRDLFLDRFTLVKNYDAGETGRFGNQVNSLPILQQLPFGLGPYQFATLYGLAPHNTFLNSFSSAGWIGGISYSMLILSHLIIGFRTIFVRTPFQPYAIAVYSCLVAVMLQGVQIDTEHWRHLYWMAGILWGFFAASFAYRCLPENTPDFSESWNGSKANQRDNQP
jgi:hypothetical protein